MRQNRHNPGMVKAARQSRGLAWKARSNPHDDMESEQQDVWRFCLPRETRKPNGCRFRKASNSHTANLVCSPMKAKDALTIGIVLLVVGAAMYAFYVVSTEGKTITEWQGSYRGTTYNVIECKVFGIKDNACILYAYLMYGACGVVSFIGVVMVVISFYRLVEAPYVSALPPPPPRLGLCPKCGVMNPPNSKHCNECGTKLTA
jgi:hypothetical protein